MSKFSKTDMSISAENGRNLRQIEKKLICPMLCRPNHIALMKLLILDNNEIWTVLSLFENLFIAPHL